MTVFQYITILSHTLQFDLPYYYIEIHGHHWQEFMEVNGLLKSDKHLISPYNVTPELHIKVMRIKEMITN